jgi:tetratricopeptide (TPR) repeat protein
MARYLKSAAALAAIGLFAASSAHAECKPHRLTLPVTMEGLQAVITTKINGEDARFQVDTGAYYSMLTPEAAKKLKAVPAAAPPVLLGGVGGMTDAEVVEVKEFDFGGIPVKHVQFIVGGRQFAPGTVGLLGENVLAVTDSEYDFANGKMAMLVFEGCFNNSLAYWDPARADAIPIDAYVPLRAAHIIGKVKINGRTVTALFDTGASRSLLTRAAAERIGIKMDGPDVKSAGISGGIGKGVVEMWTVPVESFQISGEKITGTRLTVGKYELGAADMLLGMDFFLSHHVLVSRSQNRLYFTYNGGPVFRTDEPREKPVAKEEAAAAVADEKDPDVLARRGEAFMSRREFVEALAAFDRAVELDPKSARRYVDRAKAQLATSHPLKALADYDRALELDPAFEPALVGRGAYYVWKNELAKAEADFAAAVKAAPQEADLELQIGATYDRYGRYAEAIPHYDAWIAAHPKDEQLWSGLNARCWARAMLGKDLDKALDDCNLAMRKGPRASEVLDSRGMVHLRRGELKEAIADYDAALKLQPKLPWSLYGRGLAKKRLGMTAEGEADIQAALALQPSLTDQAKRIGLIAGEPAKAAPSEPDTPKPDPAKPEAPKPQA